MALYPKNLVAFNAGIEMAHMKNIGVVVHGPEVIDSGSALKVLERLKELGNVSAVLGGTMGRVAVIDAGLEDIICINQRRKPSQSVEDFQVFVDIIILLNQGKTRETGMAFGAAVAARAAIVKPMVLVDCGGKFAAGLTETSGDAVAVISALLGLEIQVVPIVPNKVIYEGNVIKRRLSGVLPGEMISINGVVVGRAAGSWIEIHACNGKVIDILGALPKKHGIEKLAAIDLESAIIRSGDIRRTEAHPRFLNRKGSLALLIDHSAEETFEAAEGASVAVTIGDDTTAIAGDILARLSIPVIGVVDGDLDRLSHKTSMPPESIIIRVRPGYDDIVGRQIKDQIFGGNCRASIEPTDLLKLILNMAGNDLSEIAYL